MCQRAKRGWRSEPAPKRDVLLPWPGTCLHAVLPPSPQQTLIKLTDTGPFTTIQPSMATNSLGLASGGRGRCVCFKVPGEPQNHPLPAYAPAFPPRFMGCPEAGGAGGPGVGGGILPSSLVPFPCSVQRSQAAISLRPGKTSPFVWRAGRGWAAKGSCVPSRPHLGQACRGAHRLAGRGSSEPRAAKN